MFPKHVDLFADQGNVKASSYQADTLVKRPILPLYKPYMRLRRGVQD